MEIKRKPRTFTKADDPFAQRLVDTTDGKYGIRKLQSTIETKTVRIRELREAGKELEVKLTNLQQLKEELEKDLERKSADLWRARKDLRLLQSVNKDLARVNIEQGEELRAARVNLDRLRAQKAAMIKENTTLKTASLKRLMEYARQLEAIDEEHEAVMADMPYAETNLEGEDNAKPTPTTGYTIPVCAVCHQLLYCPCLDR